MPINTLAARHARYRPDHTAVVFEGDRDLPLRRDGSNGRNEIVDLVME